MPGFSHKEIFGFFHFGALLVSIAGMLVFGNWQKLPHDSWQWLVLLWLGIIASGLGYLLWNKGATMVNAGTLAVMNNALVPAGLLVNLLIWNQSVDMTRLIAGGTIILFALWLNEACDKNAPSAQQCSCSNS